MMKSRVVVAALLAASAAAGCGDDGGGADTQNDPAARQAMIEGLEELGTPEDQIECWVDELAGFDASDLDAFANATSASDMDGDFVEAVSDAAEVCAE